MYIKLSDESFKRAPAQSTLLCIEGGSAGRKIAYTDREVCFVNKLCCFHSSFGSNKYLYYQLMSPSFTQQFSSHISGLIGGVSVRVLNNFKVLRPPLDEQQRIAAYLDDKCGRIDSVISKTRAAVAEYKKLKQAIITRAVTRGIRPNRTLKHSGIEWLGDIPAHWNVCRYKYIMHKEKNICEHYNGEDIISLTMNGVIIRDLNAGGKMPVTFDGYQYVEPEDLLLCLFDIDVTPRCVGLVKKYGLTSPAYSRFKVHDGFYNAYYDYLLRAMDDQKIFVHLSKNLRSSLTESDFGASPAIVPPIDEQREIAAYLDAKCAAIDSLVAKKNQLVAELERLKKSLIFEYVTGKKEVAQ